MPSSFLVAVVVKAPTSDPASGSVRSMVPVHFPVYIFLRKSFSALADMSTPVIAHWGGNHWLVIIGYKAGQFKIADPAAGVYWLSEKEVEQKMKH